MWGSTYQCNLNRIIILQKKIIRIISKVSFDAHAGVLFKEQEILRAAVCKYRPGVGKIKISKNQKKIQWATLGTLVMKI